ncbi:hypothetical protein EXN66_Car018044 [Channa argus]|uniref:Uncharacterized protein n=1 Tax=Channa argus TaxID=215402 RepID=A0A6G1QJT3_CHAAH|nr:hypothetical protein EXN66_Car018044 [Channa argus]
MYTAEKIAFSNMNLPGETRVPSATTLIFIKQISTHSDLIRVGLKNIRGSYG